MEIKLYKYGFEDRIYIDGRYVISKPGNTYRALKALYKRKILPTSYEVHKQKIYDDSASLKRLYDRGLAKRKIDVKNKRC